MGTYVIDNHLPKVGETILQSGMIIRSKSGIEGPCDIVFGKLYCHLSVKMYRFSDNLPRCRARLADELSRTSWRCINSVALDTGSSLIDQFRAILCLHKNHAAPEAFSQRHAPFYLRNFAHLSLFSKGLNR